MNATSTKSCRSRSVAWLSVAVAALTIFVHWPAVQNGFVNWDDPLYLGNVSQLQRVSLSSIKWIATAVLPLYYHPLTWLSHLLDFQLWDWNPAGHHASSVLLHGVNAALVCLFIWLLTSAVENLSASARLAMAAGVGVAFGIHPLQVESVAWVAERKTVLCTTFSLMCLCAYVRAASDPYRKNWWAVIVLFFAALLSKPMAVTLPLAMLAMDFYPLRRQTLSSWRLLIKEKAVLFAGSAALGITTIVSQSRAGAVTGLAGFSAVARCFVAARNVVFYLWKLIWPSWLSPYYPLEGKIPLGDAEFIGSVIGVVLFTAFAFWRRRQTPVVWSAWCAYLALIAPVSGLMQVGGQGAGDRFMYLPMIPVLALAAAGCVWFWQRFGNIGRGALAPLRAGLVGLLGCLLLFYGMRTRGQIAVWHDDETLWRAAIGYFPDSVLTNWKLSLALMGQHRYEEARAYAQRAARLDPTHAAIRATLGTICVKTRQYSEAVAELEESLRLKPDMHEAQYVLACAYSRSNRPDEAYRTLQELLAAEPAYVRAIATDEELADLRDNREFSVRVRALLNQAGAK